MTWRVPPGWLVESVPITDSTNDDAKTAVRGGAVERTVFLADVQRQGRGRLGRQWVAPVGSSLLFSILLRRDLPAVVLTALCSVSVVDAIAQVTGLAARVKWPNDVMIHDRKTCGILTEVISNVGEQWTIVGIGLNVNLDPIASGLPETATSLSHESGVIVSREDLLLALTMRIDSLLTLDDRTLLPLVRDEWERLLWRREQRVAVAQDGLILTGIVEGLSETGALLLRQKDGPCIEVTVGDVFLA